MSESWKDDGAASGWTEFQKAPKARAGDSGGHDHSHTPTNQPTEIDGLAPLSHRPFPFLYCSLPQASTTNQTREREREKSALAVAAISFSHS